MSTPLTIKGIDPGSGQAVAVEVVDGMIVAVGPTSRDDATYLCPGLVDLQVNGYGGLDLNGPDITPQLIYALSKRLAGLGTTTFLPTLITAAEETILNALRVIAIARQEYALVAAMVPGVHIEGPSISPVDGPRGAHPAAHVRPPSLDEFGRWQAASDGLVRLTTLAPEYPEAEAYIRSLRAAGVHVAIGHSAATPDDIRRAIAAGASLSTHLGNGVAANLPRHPNLIWTQLAEDRLAASFIADNHHLPADTLTAMLRAKGLERSILVSDSVSLAGMPPGRYRQVVGDDVEVSANGRIGIAGTPYLAGAGLPLSANVAIAARMAGLAIGEAVQLATINPGRFVGGRGRLAVGERADLIRFSWQAGASELSVRDVWIGGDRITPE